jgi:hypothetical protein
LRRRAVIATSSRWLRGIAHASLVLAFVPSGDAIAGDAPGAIVYAGVAGARVPHGLSIGQWAAEGAKAAKALALLRVAAVAAVAMVAAAAVAAVTYWEGCWAITGIAA